MLQKCKSVFLLLYVIQKQVDNNSCLKQIFKKGGGTDTIFRKAEKSKMTDFAGGEEFKINNITRDKMSIHFKLRHIRTFEQLYSPSRLLVIGGNFCIRWFHIESF